MARGMLRDAAMALEAIVPRVQQIMGLLGDGRFDLALTLTTSLEEELATVDMEDAGTLQPIRDLLCASRLSTESLIKLRALRIH